MNIQYAIVKGFRSREISYSMLVNAYFGPRRTNIPRAIPNYGPVNISTKLIIADIHIVLRKKWGYIQGKFGKIRSRCNVFF